MKSTLDKFLPNAANRWLFPGFVCFCVAGLGAALGFLAWLLEQRWLAFVGYIITASGVLGGFIFIAHRWWQMLTGRVPRA